MTINSETPHLPEVNTYAQAIIKTAEKTVHGNCTGISLKEVTVEVETEIEPDITVDLLISINNFKNVALKADTCSVTSKKDYYIVVLKIAEIDRKSEKDLSQFYISSLWNEVTSRIPDKGVFLTPRNLVGHFDRKTISSTFKELIVANYKMFFVDLDSSYVAEIKAATTTDSEFSFEILENKRIFPKDITQRPVYVFLAQDFRQHLFVAILKEYSQNHLILTQPVLLLSSSLREEERTKVSPGTMWVEIPLPYPKGATIKREIIDISSGGFAFKSPVDSAYFLPGTPISTLRIYGKDKEPFVSAGQIRHVTPVTKNVDKPYLKIGVQLQISNKAFAKGHLQPQLTRRVKKPRREPHVPKRKFGILNTFKQLLKAGIHPQTTQTAPLAQNPDLETIPFRCLNKKNQEIVGLLNTTWKGTERKRATVIVLPPPYGKRKEALGLFGHYLIDRFKNQFKDAVVVRYDSTNHVGDSYKDPQCREPWKECLHMTLSQGTEDLLSVLDYVENNEHFLAKEIILISFSIGALLARKALTKDKRNRVHFWIAPMGATHMGDLLIRVSGGIDYFDLHKSGQDLGEVTILGITVGGNRFCEDALSRGYVTLEDALEDMSKIDIPVMWLYGEYDSWIDPENVEKLLSAKTRGWKKIKIIPTGHLPLNGEEALGVFETIFEEMWPVITEDKLMDFVPNLTELIEKQELEWKQNPKDLILSRKKYWSTYLLGQDDSDIGYDILRYCEEYVEFIREQIRLLDIEDNQTVADMGCGTGNFALQFLEEYNGGPESFPTFALVDLIENALFKARNKCISIANKKGISPDKIKIIRADLDIHPALPIKKFILGEYCSIDDLRGQIPGLTNYTINLWKKNFGKRLYYILRGKRITKRDLNYLDDIFPKEEKNIILEFNQISRIVKQIISPFCPFLSLNQGILTEKEKTIDHLLGIDLKNTVFRLPFENDRFDRIVSSLVLSYMKNPIDTLSEFARCLKPNGIMVISSMKPDTDMSGIFTKMIDRLNSGLIPLPPGSKEKYLKATRDFANSAAQLIQLVDERKFRFFHLDELLEMMEEVGLKILDTSESYGTPPQAYIVKAKKMLIN